MKWSLSAKDKKIRELATFVLTNSGIVPSAFKNKIHEEALKKLKSDTTANEEFSKWLELLDLRTIGHQHIHQLMKVCFHYMCTNLLEQTKKMAPLWFVLDIYCKAFEIFLYL